jgi:hypothetical protein
LRRIVADRSGRIPGWIAIVLMTIVSGCIIIPTPPIGINEIPAERLKVVHPGTTTRIDVLMVLGNPDERRLEDQVFLYRWDRVRAVGGVVAGPIDISDHYGFAIEFDGAGRVAGSGDFSAFDEKEFREKFEACLRSVRVKK